MIRGIFLAYFTTSFFFGLPPGLTLMKTLLQIYSKSHGEKISVTGQHVNWLRKPRGLSTTTKLANLWARPQWHLFTHSGQLSYLKCAAACNLCYLFVDGSKKSQNGVEQSFSIWQVSEPQDLARHKVTVVSQHKTSQSDGISSFNHSISLWGT